MARQEAPLPNPTLATGIEGRRKAALAFFEFFAWSRPMVEFGSGVLPESASQSAAKLLIERQQVTEAERFHARAAVRDDVVPELEHAQLVARDRRAW